jgi:hypothetical protein
MLLLSALAMETLSIALTVVTGSSVTNEYFSDAVIPTPLATLPQ